MNYFPFLLILPIQKGQLLSPLLNKIDEPNTINTIGQIMPQEVSSNKPVFLIKKSTPANINVRGRIICLC